MSTPDLERRIRTWFADEIGEMEAAPSSVYAFLGAIPQSMPREQGPFGRRAFVLLAATLLVTLLASAIAVGSGLIKLPSLFPLPTHEPEASSEATPSSPAEPSIGQPLGLVVYNVIQLIQPLPDNCTPSNHPWCHVQRIWIADGEGTGAHELLPDVPGDQQAFGWTPDGSRILYQDSACELGFADVEGSVVETLPLDIMFPTLASDECADLSAGFSFSPDGTRLAYVLGGGTPGSGTTEIAIFDLATGQMTQLEATLTNLGDESCATAANEGLNRSPSWSPDGTRLVATRDDIGPVDENHACRSVIFTVNADGTDFRVVVPSNSGSQPLEASWSPDGSRIVFYLGNYANGGVGDTCDVATIRPDGSDLRRLTSDGISCWPSWTEDGRIRFIKFIDIDLGTSDPWIMDADGGNATKLQGDSLAAFIAPRCVACPYANPDATGDALRQPLP